MATVTDKGSPATVQITQIGMTGSDITSFTFSKLLRRAQVQASAATSSMFLAGASSAHAGIVLPNGQSAPPLECDCEFAGQAVTFNGTNSTNVTVIEYLYASS